ncbi:MAG TPA: circadian clock protein KaiC [Candidatus Deferrimicrobiaceae bacterium]|nr:circadian clock protein KaiC [Candidatus Deferrimicrobiaceae bacterium]
MPSKQKHDVASQKTFAKTPSGIRGLDEITFGGLPKGRPTLIAGGPGSGKTLMSMEFLVRGAIDYNEPGLFTAFEETAEELAQNVASLGFDLKELIAEKKLLVDYVRVERREIEETGEYDLEGLFVRLNYAIDSISAKRVVLDTIESLFAGLGNEAILRAELRRLFRWLKDKGVTTIITAERGESTLTRYGLEEYVSDCVIVLDHRVQNQISTRRIRVVKYRGSVHGTNEYPFLIDEKGISILPITSLTLNHQISTKRVSSGIPRLDAMLEGKGFYVGNTIMISGTAGTGKTSIATSFAKATCQRGERCLYFAFEESPNQIMRNMKSIGIDLESYVEKGLLKFQAVRSTFYGLETHLVQMQKVTDEFKPTSVVVDPITNLISAGDQNDVKSMLTRLIDYLKAKQITTLFTNLTHMAGLESTESEVSSIMDTWILLRDIELGGERNRGIYILKSRGMAHSNQIREFLITSNGVDIVDVYTGPAGVLTGSARLSQEIKDKETEDLRKEEVEKLQRDLERNRKLMDAQIASLQAEYAAKEEEVKQLVNQEKRREIAVDDNRKEMGRMRKAENK